MQPRTLDLHRHGASLLLLAVVLACGSKPVSGGEPTFASHLLAPDPTWQALSGSRATTAYGLSGMVGNPATAGLAAGPRVGFSHLAWPGDLSREWFALASPLTSRVSFGIDGSVLHGEALQGFDAEGNETGTFQPSEWNLGGAVSFRVVGAVTVGVGARYFRLEDPSEPISGLGASLGGRVEVGTRRFGASVTDLGSAHGDTRYDLPTRWRVGAEQSLWSRAVASATLEGGAAIDPRLRLGVLIRPIEWMSLLGGLRTDDGGGSMVWSTGMSVNQRGLSASYAYRESERIGGTHQIGVEIPLRGADASR